MVILEKPGRDISAWLFLLFYRKSTIRTDIMPAKPTAIPDSAASVSPISTALALPSAWLAVPMAMPEAMLFLTLHFFRIGGKRILPKMPVIMTEATVRAGMPPTVREISMAIGVVVDFGSRDMAISSLMPAYLQMR